jgi:hypothetical protein
VTGRISRAGGKLEQGTNQQLSINISGTISEFTQPSFGDNNEFSIFMQLLPHPIAVEM